MKQYLNPPELYLYMQMLCLLLMVVALRAPDFIEVFPPEEIERRMSIFFLNRCNFLEQVLPIVELRSSVLLMPQQ